MNSERSTQPSTSQIAAGMYILGLVTGAFLAGLVMLFLYGG